MSSRLAVDPTLAALERMFESVQPTVHEPITISTAASALDGRGRPLPRQHQPQYTKKSFRRSMSCPAEDLLAYVREQELAAVVGGFPCEQEAAVEAPAQEELDWEREHKGEADLRARLSQAGRQQQPQVHDHDDEGYSFGDDDVPQEEDDEELLHREEEWAQINLERERLERERADLFEVVRLWRDREDEQLDKEAKARRALKMLLQVHQNIEDGRRSSVSAARDLCGCSSCQARASRVRRARAIIADMEAEEKRGNRRLSLVVDVLTRLAREQLEGNLLAGFEEEEEGAGSYKFSQRHLVHHLLPTTSHGKSSSRAVGFERVEGGDHAATLPPKRSRTFECTRREALDDQLPAPSGRRRSSTRLKYLDHLAAMGYRRTGETLLHVVPNANSHHQPTRGVPQNQHHHPHHQRRRGPRELLVERSRLDDSGSDHRRAVSQRNIKRPSLLAVANGEADVALPTFATMRPRRAHKQHPIERAASVAAFARLERRVERVTSAGAAHDDDDDNVNDDGSESSGFTTDSREEEKVDVDIVVSGAQDQPRRASVAQPPVQVAVASPPPAAVSGGGRPSDLSASREGMARRQRMKRCLTEEIMDILRDSDPTDGMDPAAAASKAAAGMREAKSEEIRGVASGADAGRRRRNVIWRDDDSGRDVEATDAAGGQAIAAGHAGQTLQRESSEERRSRKKERKRKAKMQAREVRRMEKEARRQEKRRARVWSREVKDLKKQLRRQKKDNTNNDSTKAKGKGKAQAQAQEPEVAPTIVVPVRRKSFLERLKWKRRKDGGVGDKRQVRSDLGDGLDDNDQDDEGRMDARRAHGRRQSFRSVSLRALMKRNESAPDQVGAASSSTSTSSSSSSSSSITTTTTTFGSSIFPTTTDPSMWGSSTTDMLGSGSVPEFEAPAATPVAPEKETGAKRLAFWRRRSHSPKRLASGKKHIDDRIQRQATLEDVEPEAQLDPALLGVGIGVGTGFGIGVETNDGDESGAQTVAPTPDRVASMEEWMAAPPNRRPPRLPALNPRVTASDTRLSCFAATASTADGDDDDEGEDVEEWEKGKEVVTRTQDADAKGLPPYRLPEDDDDEAAHAGEQEAKASMAGALQFRHSSMSQPLFGQPLADLIERQRAEEKVLGISALEVPRLLYVLCRTLIQRSSSGKMEGLFRVSGSALEVQRLKEQLEMRDYDLCAFDAFALASCMEEWLRLLPEPVIPESFYNECIKGANRPDQPLLIIDRIPEVNKNVVFCICEFVRRITQPQQILKTMMNAHSLALVFAPTLLRGGDQAVMFYLSTFEVMFVQNLFQSYSALGVPLLSLD